MEDYFDDLLANIALVPYKMICPSCKATLVEGEDTIHFLNVHSDVFEQDVYTFKCPRCQNTVDSLMFL